MGPALSGVFALILVGAMVTLVVVLTRACGAGGKSIEAYVASIRAGANVTPALAGVEAEAVTKALRDSRSLSVGNFQSQQGTSCFWVTMKGNGPSVDVRFVLAERPDKEEVVAVSLARECECPVDIHKPCALK
jgi:hypothetical protein